MPHACTGTHSNNLIRKRTFGKSAREMLQLRFNWLAVEYLTQARTFKSKTPTADFDAKSASRNASKPHRWGVKWG
jgi:hypothetical protein